MAAKKDLLAWYHFQSMVFLSSAATIVTSEKKKKNYCCTWILASRKAEGSEPEKSFVFSIHSFCFNSSLHVLLWVTPLGGNKATSQHFLIGRVSGNHWLSTEHLMWIQQLDFCEEIQYFDFFQPRNRSCQNSLLVLSRKTKLEPLWHVICIYFWCSLLPNSQKAWV